VKLGSVGPQVQQIVFVVNIYDKDVTFAQVANPYCRIVDNTISDELCKYSLSEAGSENGLIVSRIAREKCGRWGFHALGIPCRGRTYKDSLRQIFQICHVDTRSLSAGSETAAMAGVPPNPASATATMPGVPPNPASGAPAGYTAGMIAQPVATSMSSAAPSLRRGSTQAFAPAEPMPVLKRDCAPVGLQLGQSVLVLRGSGAWSPATVTDIQPGGVTVTLQEGGYKQIPAHFLHQQVRSLHGEVIQGYTGGAAAPLAPGSIGMVLPGSRLVQ